MNQGGVLYGVYMMYATFFLMIVVIFIADLWGRRKKARRRESHSH